MVIGVILNVDWIVDAFQFGGSDLFLDFILDSDRNYYIFFEAVFGDV